VPDVRETYLNRCSTVLVRSSPVFSDSRIEKETQALSNQGFKVIVLAWDREGKFKTHEAVSKTEIFRFKFPAPYDKLVVVVYFPFFWLWAALKLLTLRPRIIHVCDIDSSPPCIFCKFLLRNTRLVLDIFDTYTLLVQKKNKNLAKLVRIIELSVASLSDGFITVSENRLDFFKSANLKRTTIVMNCPPLNSEPVDFLSESNNRPFRLVYAGVVAEGRGLIEIAEALKGVNNAELLIAGRILSQKIAAQLEKYPNVRYVGQFTFREAINLQRSADVIPLLYDPGDPINRVASPNKLFEAMMLGKPILTNLPIELTKVCFGVEVGYHDIAGIKKAIVNLKENPQLRRNLGNKGRISFEKEYNWSVMEMRLVTLYNDLLATTGD
jgi:glycosyltransferase involved in cell wall biosynthesis